jgi:hypothetical protein
MLLPPSAPARRLRPPRDAGSIDVLGRGNSPGTGVGAVGVNVGRFRVRSVLGGISLLNRAVLVCCVHK